MLQDKENFIAVTSLSAAIWIVFCIAVFIGFDGELSLVVLFLVGLFTYASVMLWSSVFNESMAPLELTFWLFNTNFLLLPALSQSVYHAFYWSSYNTYKQESLLYACVIIAIGFFSFSLGRNICHRKFYSITFKSKIEASPGGVLEETWGMRLFIMAGLAVVVLSILRLGLTFFLSNRSSSGAGLGGLSSDIGLMITLPRALAVGILLFSIFFIVRQMRQGRKVTLSTYLVLLSAISVNAIANYPLAISRFWFFGFLISLIWIVSPLRSALRRSIFVIGLTLMQFTVFPWFSQLSRGKGGIHMNIESFRRYLHHGDYDGFQSIVNIALYIQESGMELGRNIISVILFFIPRAFWENKAEPLGVEAAKHMGYTFTNLSAPIYGEFYADFGLLSLVLGMGLVGYGIHYFDRYFDHMIRSKQFGINVLYTAVISGYLIILLRGSLLAIISGITIILGVLVILNWLSMRTKHSNAVNDQFKQQ